jgi:hypothetical protein
MTMMTINDPKKTNSAISKTEKRVEVLLTSTLFSVFPASL